MTRNSVLIGAWLVALTIATATQTVRFNLPSIAGDPGTVADGDLWYNSSTGHIRGRSNGSTLSLDLAGSGGSGVITGGSCSTGQVVVSIDTAGVPTCESRAEVLIDTNNPNGTGTVTFNSLGSYTHLKIRYSAQSAISATNDTLIVQVNGDTGANYDRQEQRAAGTSTTAAEVLGATSWGFTIAGSTATAGSLGMGEINLFDYRGTTFHHGGSAMTGWQLSTAGGNFSLRTVALRWRSTSAITSVVLSLASNNFTTGSKFSLYGYY